MDSIWNVVARGTGMTPEDLVISFYLYLYLYLSCKKERGSSKRDRIVLPAGKYLFILIHLYIKNRRVNLITSVQWLN